MLVFDLFCKNVNWVKAAMRKMSRRIVYRAFHRWEEERQERPALSLRERRHLDQRLEDFAVATPQNAQDLASSGSLPRSTSPHRWTVLLDSPAPSPQRKGNGKAGEVQTGGGGPASDTLLFKPAPWEQEKASGGVKGSGKDGWVWESAEGDGDPEHLLCMEALPLMDLDASLELDADVDHSNVVGGLSSGVPGRQGMVLGHRELSWGAGEDDDLVLEGGRMSIGMLSDSLSPISTDSSPTSLGSCLSPQSLASPTTRMATISERDPAENHKK